MTDPQLPSAGVPPVPPEPYGAVPPPAAPPYPQPPVAPGHPPFGAPVHHQAPVYQAPPGAYQVPVGGYAVPAGGYQAPAVPQRQAPFLGVLALVFSLVAAIVTPIVAGFAAYEIGRRIPEAFEYVSDVDTLAFLSPARDQVLWAELAFWAGTLLGIAAIVVGIIAIRRRQGRGQGIAALIVAVIAPMIFLVVLVTALSTGTAAGFIDYDYSS